ncbi:MAG: hypothetical protein Q4F83_01870 [Eubacteriales bacterium]|nr:hypothetical protein [Eubacteriales bacterium]
MKCYVCGKENLNAALSRCPQCGFPMLRTVGGEQAQDEIQKMVRDYQEKYFGNAKISVTSYSYEIQESNLKLREKFMTVLAERYLDLDKGEISWSEQSFAGIDEGENFVLKVLIEVNEKKVQKEISMTASKTKSLWKIGVLPEDGISFCIVVGEKENYARSERISLSADNVF